MKIALITDGIYPFVMGGMQKHSFYLAKYLAREQVYVDLYHYIPKESSKLKNEFSDMELDYISLIELEYPKKQKFPGHYLYERYQYSRRVLMKFITRPEPDFIYAKGFAGWALLRERKKMGLNSPIGVNFHGFEMFQKWPDIKTGIKFQSLKLPVLEISKKTDFLFSYGGKISEIISALGYCEKIIEIPTGIANNWILNSLEFRVEPVKKFVFVGRYERRKGIQELNSVLKSLSGDVLFEFHFIGPISENFQIKDTRVVYHGPLFNQQEIQNILTSADILVCPSYSEGMPNVILEGMASGCAIIASDVGAVSAMVDSSNGWLIAPGSAKELKAVIQESIELENDVLETMKSESIQKVKNSFLWEVVIKKTMMELKNKMAHNI